MKSQGPYLTSVIRCSILMLSLSTASFASTIYQFDPFQVCPGCSTSTGGINDAGIVGANSPTQGYLYNSATGTAVPVPGALAISVPSNDGRAPGLSTSLTPLISESDGTVNTYAGYPGAGITALIALNNSGEGVGWASLDFTTFFGFERSPSGTYTQVNYPNALPLGTFILGENAAGTEVGYTADATETQFAGFLRLSDGTFQAFNIPGAQSTLPYGINDNGTIVGGYQDSSGVWHGFVWSKGTYQTVDDPGAPDTNITGINNNGVLVGDTFNSPSPLAGPFNAFIATPVPEPAEWGMLLIACVVLARQFRTTRVRPEN